MVISGTLFNWYLSRKWYTSLPGVGWVLPVTVINVGCRVVEKWGNIALKLAYCSPKLKVFSFLKLIYVSKSSTVEGVPFYRG